MADLVEDGPRSPFPGVVGRALDDVGHAVGGGLDTAEGG